jgi:hypothetical protein
MVPPGVLIGVFKKASFCGALGLQDGSGVFKGTSSSLKSGFWLGSEYGHCLHSKMRILKSFSGSPQKKGII